MSNYILSCCSTADLTKEHFENRQIPYVCFHYYIDGVEYTDDLGQSVSFEDFYQKIADGAEPTTAQVNADEYKAFFLPYLESGKDIVHVSLSSGISGSYNSANIAKAELEQEFPERKIFVIDSKAASSGYGLFMDILADARDAGKSAEELAAYAEEIKLNIHHWFFSSDLTSFIRGGRISKTAGFFGSMLGVCPLLNMDNEGRLIPREKIRTKKKVKLAIVDKMKKHAKDGINYSGKCFISQSACYEDARDVADMIEAAFPNLNGKVLINYVGTTIGSHTGRGTVALFFVGDERVD